MDDKQKQLIEFQQECCREVCGIDPISRNVHESIIGVIYWPLYSVLRVMEIDLTTRLQEDVLIGAV